MTVLQKKSDNPIAHLSPDDIEDIGRRLDAIRAEVIADRGASDAAYIRKVIKVQRTLEMSSRALLLVSKYRPAWFVGTAGLAVAKILENMEIGHNIMHGQWDWMRDDKIHSTTWEWDNASPSDQWKHSHNELHHTYTNVIGRDNDLGYGIMRVDEDQRWVPMYLAQPLWNFLNACFFEFGIAAYDLELGKNLKTKRRRSSPEFKAARDGDAAQDPRPGAEGLRRAPGAVGPVVPVHARCHRDGEPDPQPVDALGHHVRPLPGGRADLRAALDRG